MNCFIGVTASGSFQSFKKKGGVTLMFFFNLLPNGDDDLQLRLLSFLLTAGSEPETKL